LGEGDFTGLRMFKKPGGKNRPRAARARVVKKARLLTEKDQPGAQESIRGGKGPRCQEVREGKMERGEVR